MDLNCEGKKIKPDKDFLKYIGINFVPDAHAIVGYLRELVSSFTTDKKKFEKVYRLLSDNFDEELSSVFMQEPLIYIPRSDQKYYRIREVIWENKKDTLGGYWGYLSEHYSELKKFFIEQLGVAVGPTLKHYVGTLRKIAEKYELGNMVEVDKGDKGIIIKIYEKISDMLLEDEDYDESLFENLRVLTTNRSFVKGEQAYICDITYLRDDIDYRTNDFLWMPDNYNFKRIEPFLKAINVNFLSVDMKMNYGDEISNCSKSMQNKDIGEIAECIRRYIYHTNISTYEEYKKSGVFCKLITLDVYECPSEIAVNISHSRLGINVTKFTNAFWDYRKNFLIKTKNTPLEDIGEALCKGLPTEVNGLLPAILYITREWENRQLALSKVGIASLPSEERKVYCEKEDELLETDISEGRTIEERKSEENLTETAVFEEGVSEDQVIVDKETSPTNKEVERKISVSNNKGSQKTIRNYKKSKLTHTDTKNKNISRESQMSAPTSKNLGSTYEVLGSGTQNTLAEGYSTEDIINPEKVDLSIDENEMEGIFDIDPSETMIVPLNLRDETYSEQNIDDRKSSKMKSATSSSERSGKRRKIGSWAEEAIYYRLKNHLKEEFGVDGEVIWVNGAGEAYQPYDILIKTKESKEIYVEIKGTNKSYAGGEDIIMLSEKEYNFMRDHISNYVIYRVFNVGKINAHYIKIDDFAELEKKGKIKIIPKTKVTYMLHLNI